MLFTTPKKKLLFLILVLITQSSLARFMSEKEASIDFDAVNHDIQVYKDFTFDCITTEHKTLKNESARENMNLVQLTYEEDFESTKVLDAKIINNEEEHLVDLNLIEDKKIASQALGFKDIRQISIPFKNVNVGSKILLKYATKINKPQIDNHLSTVLHYGNLGYWKRSTTTIASEIPLFLHINDPFKVLKVESSKKSGLYHYKIELLKPFTNKTINEPSNSILNPELQTSVSISTDNSWEEFGHKLAVKYETVVNKPLLTELKKQTSETKNLKGSDADRINHITAFIQNKIRYLGDWKTTEKGFYPREIKTVLETQYGDCKDFSALTIAMLREVGFTAKFVLVNRGKISGNHKYILPIGSSFNHAMVYAKSSDGTVYWIDPTNSVSMANGIFPDIADRYALVLDIKDSLYTKIPAINFETNKINIDSIYKLESKGLTKEANASFFNESAISMTGATLFAHKDIIEDYIYSTFTEENVDKKNRIKTVIPDLNSRVVKNINLELQYNVTYPYAKTNAGKALSLSSYVSDYPKDSINDIYLGSPHTFIKKYTFDKEVSNVDSLNAEISTPWVNLARKGSAESGKTIIVEEFVIKKSYLTKKDRESKQYQTFKNDVNTHFRKPLLIFPEN